MLKLSPRWRKIWADLTTSKARTALVVMSIVVGIFAVGSIAGTSAILNRESKTLWQAVDPASAVLVTTVFDESVIEQVAALPEIDAVQVRRSYDARVESNPGEYVDLRLFAVPDYENMTLNTINGESGAYPPADDTVLVERSADGFLNTAEGQDLTIELPTGETVTLPVTGIVYDLSQPAASVLGTGYGYVSMATMEAITGETGYNNLQFRVSENADDADYVAQVSNTVRDLLESQGTIVFTVVPQDPAEPPSFVFILALLLVLGVIGSLTFILSGFLIVNIISAVLAQQTKQIGIMKAIGARTGQIIRMYLGLIGIFGVIALLIGVPLSFFGARGLASIVGELSNYKITNFSIPLWVFAVQIFIGLVVPITAALIPVIAGTRTNVREALDSRGIDSNNNGIFDRIITRFQGLPRPVLLSFRNTFRQKGRLVLTLLTLTLAGAIFATVFTVRNSLFNTLDDALGYDNYGVSVSLSEAYPADEMVALAENIDGVERVEAWATATGRTPQTDTQESAGVNLRGLPPTSETILPLIEAGRWLEEGDTNGVVVNNNIIAAYPDLSVGDDITLILRGQETTWTIVGIAQAIFSFENDAWTTYDALSEIIGEGGQSRLLRMTTSENSADAQNAIVEQLSTAFAENNFLIDGTQTRAALETSFDLRFNTLVYSLLVLAGLLAIVGGLGIAGTTSINVLERMREIGVMRSVGASDFQVLGIFVAEAVFVGIIGWVLGSLLALPISRALSDGVGNAFSNAPLAYSFDVTGAILWLVLALFLAFISSYLPARRASQLTLREVLSYEG
ncbi:MAG: ABC transporter permease [Aggregatilineales bacterium]